MHYCMTNTNLGFDRILTPIASGQYHVISHHNCSIRYVIASMTEKIRYVQTADSDFS
jgi:hypothetical protein